MNTGEKNYRNYYKHCKQEWDVVWDSTCNDKCPCCGDEIEPYKSDDLRPITKVIFRKFVDGGDLIALFPEIPGSNDPFDCSSYQHIGQHGAATLDIIDPKCTTLVKNPKEYADLKTELENHCGYRLKVIQRVSPSMNMRRIAELQKEL